MSKNSTSTDLGLAYDVSDEKLKKFNLSSHLVSLMWDEPFYSRILRSLTKVETDQIPTAGVLATENDITLWWNRRFLASLSRRKVGGLLKHECLHLVYEHTTSRRKDPHVIWNWATDLAINSQLTTNELPKGGLVPGKKLMRLTAKDKSQMTDDQISKYEGLSKLIESFDQGQTSEWYFNRLKEDPGMQAMAEGDQQLIVSCGEGMDDHSGWDELSEEARELVGQKLKEIIKDAACEANEKGWGSVSHELQKEIRSLISTKINWKSLLKRFCGFSRRQERTSSVHKLNRKYPMIHPGHKKNYRSTIAVYVDESGSVYDEDLELVYGELNSLARNTDFWLYKFDTQVNEREGFLWKEGKTKVMNRSQCGGTCFKAPSKHANDNKSKFDGYIIITDGYAPKPQSSKLKRCWIVTPNGRMFDNPDGRDIVIKLER